VAAVACVGCGALFEDFDGPTHRYMESSPGCWAVYGEVLAREYGDVSYAFLHRLTVDTYAVQHPGRPSPQSTRSVALHLMSLCLVLERGLERSRATAFLQTAAEPKGQYVWLDPPVARGAITVTDVHGSGDAAEHRRLVRIWAESTWSSWSRHHATIRAWLLARDPGGGG
jgi:hypothetical protein